MDVIELHEDPYIIQFLTVTDQGGREIRTEWELTRPPHTQPNLFLKEVEVNIKGEISIEKEENAISLVPDSHVRKAREYAAQIWDRKRWNYGINYLHESTEDA